MRFKNRQSAILLFLTVVTVTFVSAIALLPKPEPPAPIGKEQAARTSMDAMLREKVQRNNIILMEACASFHARHGRFPTLEEVTPDIFPGRKLPTNPYTGTPIAIIAVNRVGEPLYAQPDRFTLRGNYGFIPQKDEVHILSLRMDGSLYEVITSSTIAVDSTTQSALAPHQQ